MSFDAIPDKAGQKNMFIGDLKTSFMVGKLRVGFTIFYCYQSSLQMTILLYSSPLLVTFLFFAFILVGNLLHLFLIITIFH